MQSTFITAVRPRRDLTSQVLAPKAATFHWTYRPGYMGGPLRQIKKTPIPADNGNGHPTIRGRIRS